MREESRVAKALAATVVALVLLGLASLGSRVLLGYRSNLESITAIGRPDTLSAWYLTVVWAAGAALSILLAREDGRRDRVYWILLSLLCLAASQEATVGAFERFVLPARFVWPIFDQVTWVSLAVALALFAFSWGFISRQKRATRGRLVLAFVLYVLTLIIEGVGRYAAGWVATRLLAHSIMSALQSGLLMSAASIVVYALWVEVGERHRLVVTPKGSTAADG